MTQKNNSKIWIIKNDKQKNHNIIGIAFFSSESEK